MKKLVVAIGDTHFPFANLNTIARIIKLLRDLKPDVVVQMGDLYDWYAASKYPRSQDVMKPGEEIERGRMRAEVMWRTVRDNAPKATCYQLMGNHDDRPLKRIRELTPALESLMMKSVGDLMAFPGVTTVGGREELIIDGVAYEHGALQVGQHALENQRPTVVGHSHVGGVWHRGKLWELNAGWCGDIGAPCFNYVRTKIVAQKTTQGFGAVDEYGPRFIPLP